MRLSGALSGPRKERSVAFFDFLGGSVFGLGRARGKPVAMKES